MNNVKGMEVGTTTIKGTAPTKTINFKKSFSNTPLVFVQTQTAHDSGQTRNTIVTSRSTSSFTLQFCDQSSADSCEFHDTETVAYWAIDPSVASKGNVFDWGTVSDTDSAWKSISFSQSYSSTPVVLVGVESNSGSNQALYPEADAVSTTGASIRYCESDAGNACNSNPTETVAWLSVSTGTLNP
ncbi:MAG: hypothetical protein ABEJ99_06045 [Candidatus Nanohaloarchaea archaeon]